MAPSLSASATFSSFTWSEKSRAGQENRNTRAESERFKCFSYEELASRDKVNLDIFWIKDEGLEDLDNLPVPSVIAAEIVESLEAALEQFRLVAEELGRNEDCQQAMD